MPKITYNAKLLTEFNESFVDNQADFNRNIKEVNLGFFDSFTQTNLNIMSTGFLDKEPLFIEDNKLRRTELNGICLLLTDLEDGFMKADSPDIQVNNNTAYIFERVGNKVYIKNQYEVEYDTDKFVSDLAYPVFISQYKDSAKEFTTTDLVDIANGISNWLTANSMTIEEFSKYCEFVPISEVASFIDPPATFRPNIKTRYFPLDSNNSAFILYSDGSIEQADLASAERYNGIIRPNLDTLTEAEVEDIEGFYLFYATVPAYYPFVSDPVVPLENSKTLKKLVASSKTSSLYEHIWISPREFSLAKDTPNTETQVVTINNDLGEYIYITPDQDIQFNGKLVEKDKTAILPGKYTELKVKLARSVYEDPLITQVNIDLGVYDRYNNLKKLIDTIIITIT